MNKKLHVGRSARTRLERRLQYPLAPSPDSPGPRPTPPGRSTEPALPIPGADYEPPRVFAAWVDRDGDIWREIRPGVFEINGQLEVDDFDWVERTFGPLRPIVDDRPAHG